ncbi:MAG TPA: AAA family ATPase, partial [Pseudolysinimonas sp.]
MWPANRRDDDLVNDDETTSAKRPVAVSRAGAFPDRARSSRAGDIADPVRSQWRAELATVGGRSPLLHFVDDSSTRIELSTTHPGGLARFITGQTTLLSQLIRDDVALRSARLAADSVTAKGLELSTTRGIDSVRLGIGLACWSAAGGTEEFRAPILLRPLAIRRHGRDFELKLRGTTMLNPALATALERQFQLVLDPDAFVALSDADGSFKPNAVIDQLRALTGHLADFSVQPRLLVSSFAEVAPELVADAFDLEHPVLDALAGNATARWSLEEASAPVEPVDSDHRDPSTDVLLLDADSEQEQVIAQIAAGNSLVVKTMPGTGGTQTIVNSLGT